MTQETTMHLMAATRPVFINFAQRDLGLSAAHAAWEFDHQLNLNGRPVLLDFYLHCRRTDAPFAMSRADRRDLHMTFENARAHAWFALDESNA